MGIGSKRSYEIDVLHAWCRIWYLLFSINNLVANIFYVSCHKKQEMEAFIADLPFYFFSHPISIFLLYVLIWNHTENNGKANAKDLLRNQIRNEGKWQTNCNDVITIALKQKHKCARHIVHLSDRDEHKK